MSFMVIGFGLLLVGFGLVVRMIANERAQSGIVQSDWYYVGPSGIPFPSWGWWPIPIAIGIFMIVTGMFG